MEKTDYKTYFNFISLTLMIFLFVNGLSLASNAIATFIDGVSFNTGITAMLLISGLAILGSVGTYFANKFKPSKTLEIAGFIVDAAVLLILFILGIVIVVVSGMVSPGVANWVALIMLAIVFALHDVTTAQRLSKELKGLQEASAAAAAAASIAEAENIKDEKNAKLQQEASQEEVVNPEVIEDK